MKKYMIGIIDESDSEVLTIERTIYANKPETIPEDQIDFLVYPLPNSVDRLLSEISKQVIEDVIADKIHALIVDYKIIVASTCIEGTEIFKKISAAAPKFPTIILTNVPEDCYDKVFVDADKVYAKRSFFKLEESDSKEKVLNVFRNIENYQKKRTSLTVNLKQQLDKYTREGYTPEVYQNIIQLENILSSYIPQEEQSAVEKALNLSELKDAVELLEKANGLLHG